MTSAAAPANDRLMLAVLIASAIHVLVIFGITFDAWRANQSRHQVEVTLVQNPNRRPTEADHIAQADQTGSGSEALRDLAAGEQMALPQTPRAVGVATGDGQQRPRTPGSPIRNLHRCSHKDRGSARRAAEL